MNVREYLEKNGICVSDLILHLVGYQGIIVVPSHYEQPIEYIEAVGLISTINDFLKLLEDDGQNKLLEGDGSAGEFETPATNGKGE